MEADPHSDKERRFVPLEPGLLSMVEILRQHRDEEIPRDGKANPVSCW